MNVSRGRRQAQTGKRRGRGILAPAMMTSFSVGYSRLRVGEGPIVGSFEAAMLLSNERIAQQTVGVASKATRSEGHAKDAIRDGGRKIARREI